MVSVMNSDCDIDRKYDARTEEIEAKPRFSGDTENLMNSGVENEARISPMKLDSVAPESERSEEFKVMVRVSSESDNNNNNNTSSMDNEMESGVFEVEKNKESVNQIDSRDIDHFDGGDDEFDDRNDTIEARNGRTVSDVGRVDGQVEVYKSLLFEFDDFVANEKMNAGTSRALSYGFEVGDMVWGKVKSHPWWPGHIFNEDFALSSVHRMRRDGHVLVAFFGDSSYGWFDPAELIPFDLHFMEKSQQTNSRTFVKAVEEAVDEASRRCELALACKCRNPHNFCPTNVQGYFTVDVPDFEPGGLFWVNQIEKARDRFQPAETLSFVRQLASSPRDCDQMSIDFIKNKATISAFRKAVFEEFDDTYAQAFGVQPTRPSHDRSNVLVQSAKPPPKAPLSGPLVIAEALGDGKSSKKPMKVKDHSKKDRYLFKRRDEPGDSRASQISQGQAGSLSPSAVIEGSSAIAAGDYILQKRALVPQTPVKCEQTGFISKVGAGLSGILSGKEAVSTDHASAYSSSPAIQGAALDLQSSLDAYEMKMRMGPDVVLDSRRNDMSEGKAEVMVDIKNEESAKMPGSSKGLQKSEPSFSVREEGVHGLDQVQDSRMSAQPLLLGAKSSVKVSPDGKSKKPKSLNRPLGDLSSEKPMVGEPKKKKKKKEFDTETNSDHQQKRSAAKLTKKSTQAGLGPREDLWMNNQKKDVGANTSVLSSVETLPGLTKVNIEVGLAQLLRDLHALALDPFYGAERNCSATIRQCFLQFRSLVFQKSLVLLPPSETEPVEGHTSKSSSSISSSGENIGDLPAKPVKHITRPDDPTKAGRKRLPSDRQEEIAAKRLKKINQMKSLTSEKKSSQRTLDGQRVEGKEHLAAPPPRSVKPGIAKKLESPSRAVEPTMLVMKFPPETSLPSGAELKARFGRFGSIDQSAIRVFWKSFTCRVVFKHKADAQAAYKYAIGNNTLFGNVKVRYILREVEAPAPEVPDFEKVRGDEPSYETPRIKDPMADRPTPAPGLLPQPNIPLKSCLKKPASDEAGQVTTNNGTKGTTRVTFILGGEESNRAGQMMIGGRNNFNSSSNASFTDGGSALSSSSVAMDYNSQNLQKVIPPFSSSSVPPHSQFAKPLYNNTHVTEVGPPRNSHNLNTPTIPPPPPPSAPSIDISQQMLGLLTRCNDVITNVTSLLGYVPYHPL